MKRTAMKRKTAIRRKGAQPSKPKRPSKYARRPRDIDFMLWVKTLPCMLAGDPDAGPCTGVVEADHAGQRGLGQKAPDDTCIPLCSGHHLARHACLGFFRGRSKQWKRDWRVAAIEQTQREYLVMHGG